MVILKKIVLNFGYQKSNLKYLISGLLALEFISSKKGKITKSRHLNLFLKIKKGDPVGCKIVLKKVLCMPRAPGGHCLDCCGTAPQSSTLVPGRRIYRMGLFNWPKSVDARARNRISASFDDLMLKIRGIDRST